MFFQISIFINLFITVCTFNKFIYKSNYKLNSKLFMKYNELYNNKNYKNIMRREIYKNPEYENLLPIFPSSSSP